MSADHDAATAFQKRWNDAQLPETVKGGLVRDQAARDRGTSPDDRPYAVFSVEQGPHPNEYSTGGEWIDYRKIALKIFGVGEDSVSQALSTVRQGIEDRSFFPWPLAGGTFMRLEPLPGEKISVDPAGSREGEDYRVAEMAWCLWSERTKG